DRLKKQGRSPRTLNSYRDALATFCNWCIADGILEESPVAMVRKARSPAGKKHRPRRAYTPEEFRRFLLKCRDRRRRLLYTVAGLSGLRRNELRLLEKRDLSPVGDRPIWHLRPEITKGKRRDVVPMLPECAS